MYSFLNKEECREYKGTERTLIPLRLNGIENRLSREAIKVQKSKLTLYVVVEKIPYDLLSAVKSATTQRVYSIFRIIFMYSYSNRPLRHKVAKRKTLSLYRDKLIRAISAIRGHKYFSVLTAIGGLR